MNLGLKNKVGIVTGSSQGIGKAIAKRFASEGVNVVICSRNIEKLNNTSNEIKDKTGADVVPIRADLTKRKDITKLVEKTVQTFGTIDILVNNTGGPPSMYFSETTEQDWKKASDQLLMSIIHCSHGVIPHMKKQRWGRIINMTSFAAKQPQESLILSNTFRAGILGLTKTISNEVSEDNVLVNAVCPGWTLTERLVELAQSKAEQTGKKYETVLDEWAKQIPIGRLAKPDEIANVVTFLASESASYMTGCTVQVDGGFIKSII